MSLAYESPSPSPVRRPPQRPDRPLWTEDEVAILRLYYPAGGLRACRRLLADKTDGAIYQKARLEGLNAPGFGGPREQWTSTPWLDDAIRRHYAGNPKKGDVGRLALRLHRPARWISHRARQLGVVPPRLREPPWSPQEIALLHKHAGKTLNRIVIVFRKHGFRRTTGAIKNALKRYPCDRIDDDNYTGRQFAELMGIDMHRVSAWIARGWLKAGRRGTSRDNDILAISRSAARRFIIENAGAIDIRRVEKFWFIDLLADKT